MKLVTFACAPEGQDRAAFQSWFVDDHIPFVMKQAPSLLGGVVRRRIDVAEFPVPAANQSAEVPAFDIFMEMWFPTTEDFRREVLPAEERLAEIGSVYSSYGVTPRLQKDPRISEGGAHGGRPEVTIVVAFKWRPPVTAELGSAYYQGHTPIALRTQKAMTRYEQNMVQDTISWTPGTSTFDAYADFSFRTRKEMLERFVFTQEEWQDVSRYLGSSRMAFFGDYEPFGPLA